MTGASESQERLPGFYDGPGVNPACRPFAILNGADQLAIFLHGLTGSPADYRHFVKAYVDAGFDVAVPLTPGHGSHISYLERLTYRELYIPFEPLFNYLRPRYAKVHTVGLSYGAVLNTQLALAKRPDTVSFLAPAFFLTIETEKNLELTHRLKLHKLKSRVSKKNNRDFSPHPHTYPYIPFPTAVDLHKHAALLRSRLGELTMPVFHAHGDADETTPLQKNHDLLRTSLRDYRFHRVSQGFHVLPLFDDGGELTRVHLDWLREHT